MVQKNKKKEEESNEDTVFGFQMSLNNSAKWRLEISQIIYNQIVTFDEEFCLVCPTFPTVHKIRNHYARQIFFVLS